MAARVSVVICALRPGGAAAWIHVRDRRGAPAAWAEDPRQSLPPQSER
jgi:hypothetical protein